MTPEVTSQHLDDIDIIIAKYRLLGENNYIQTAFGHTIDAAQYLSAIYGEKRDTERPVIQPPTQETVVDFADGVLADIDALTKNLIKDSDITDVKDTQSAVVYVMAWSRLKQAEMFVKVFFEDAKAEKKEFEEYNTRLKEATDIIFLVNEDVKLQSYVEPAIKSIWPSIYEKDNIYFHNEIEEYISKFMKAPNVKYDSLHCDECLKKFDISKTIFILIGFKRDDKLPVDLPQDAYEIRM